MSLRNLFFCGVALSVVAVLPGCSKDPEVAKREFVESGDKYVAEGKYPEAVIEYRNAVNQDPRYAEARQKLAEAYRESGDMNAALGEYVRAADVLTGDADAQVKAGQFLLLARQYEEAESRANKALAVNPRHVEAQILKANAFAGLNRLDDALTEIEEAIGNDPSQISSYSSLGIIQMIRGDRALAEAAFKKAVETDPAAVGARLALANFYWISGRRPEAETELKSALTTDPKNSLANRMMALLHLGTGRVAEAEPFLRVMAENASSDDGKLTLADYYVSAGRIDDARKILDEVAATGKGGFARATLRLAGLGAVTKDMASTERLVDSVLAKEPNNVEALQAKTLLHSRAGKMSDALATAQAAVRAGPSNSRAHFILGEIHLRRGEADEAIRSFADALKFNPRMAVAELELAKIHLGAGRVDDAEHFARSALSKVSGALEAHLMMARINLTKGNIAVAERALRPMVKALPKDPRVQTEVAQLELKKGNLPAARAAFARALELQPRQFDALKGIIALDIQSKQAGAVKSRLDAAVKVAPDNPDVLLLAARAYRLLGDLPAAETFYGRVIDADADNLGAYVELAQLHVASKQVDEAIARFEQLTKLEPTSIPAQTILGMLLQSRNRLPEAQARYEAVLARDPSAAVAANNLAMIYSESGTNLDMALQYAQTAKSRLPDRPEINDTLGWLYYKKNMPKQALGALSESVRLAPGNPTYHYHLGLAHVQDGDRSRARAAFTQALALSQSFHGAEDAKKNLAELNQ